LSVQYGPIAASCNSKNALTWFEQILVNNKVDFFGCDF
jgi:hypothetical protein